MCFSAPASFLAGASLGAAGTATIRNTLYKRDIPIALVPLLFSIQQITEGVIWLSFAHPDITFIASKIFLVFAYGIWPAFIPYAIYRAEVNHLRRVAISPLMWGGFLVGLHGLYSALFTPTTVALTCGSVQYGISVWNPAYGFLYVYLTCFAPMLSSSKWLRVFGVGCLLSYFLAYRISAETGDSVWCFFAALLSMMIYLHIHQSHQKAIESKRRRVV